MRIISKAPTRISLMGGGTDLPTYSDKHGGLCISFTVNLLSSLKLYTEDNLFDIAKNELPYRGEADFIHKIFTEFNMGSFHDVRFISKSDALLSSGLGTSAAITVATIGAINKAKNLGMTKPEIAEKAFEIESRTNPTGRQDAYASTYGGFNVFSFEKNQVEVQPLNPEILENLTKSMVLIHTGEARAKAIQMTSLTKDQIGKLDQTKELALKAIQHINDVPYIGKLLNESWEIKKQVNPNMSGGWIDEVYHGAMITGAYGGKLLGSGGGLGGGGYMLFIVPPETDKADFAKGLEVDLIDFETTQDGLSTRIL